MVVEVEVQDYQVKVVYLGFLNQSFICVQLIDKQIQLHNFFFNLEFGSTAFKFGSTA